MTELDELAPVPDPESLRVLDFDVRNAVFVIPSDSPVPSELSSAEMPSGSLYRRLAALDQPEISEFAFVPVSGSELLSLDRAWRALQSAPRVYALFDLPGARYDVLFTQAARQIGIPRVEWPAVAEALASRVRTVQRTKDKEPWNMKQDFVDDPVAVRKNRVPKSSTGRSDELPIPEGADED
jgi:hypothetical protein